MKKLLLIFIMVIPLIVNADETIYTNYYLKESMTSNEYPENDLLKKEEITIYNNYQIERVNYGYYETNSNYIKDETDFIKEYSYSKNKGSNSLNQYTYYKTEDNIEVNKFEIRWYSVSSLSKIESIKIYDKEKLIYESQIDKISSNVRMIFELKDYVSLQNIKIDLKIQDKTMCVFSGTLTAYSKTSEINNRFSFKRYSLEEMMTINYISESSYNELLTKISWTPDTNYITFFPIKKIKYQYYELKKVYLNKYTKEPLDNYYLDYSDYKKLYNYYERYYIKLADKIIDYNNPKTAIISTNIDLDKLQLELIENENNYILKLKYLDDTIVKSYKKELIIPSNIDKENTNQDNVDRENNATQDNENNLEKSSSIEVTVINKDDQNDKEIKVRNYQSNNKSVNSNLKDINKNASIQDLDNDIKLTTTKANNQSTKNSSISIFKVIIKIIYFLLIILFVYKKIITKRNKKSNIFKWPYKK